MRIPVSNATSITSQHRLQMGDAAVGILMLEDRRYVLQLRDDSPAIWYPNHWGLFGGSIESNERPIAALRRELYEELEIEFDDATLFTSYNFDLRPAGLQSCSRMYFEVAISEKQFSDAVLHEGSGVRAPAGLETLALSPLSPYDDFAIFLHHIGAASESRVATGFRPSPRPTIPRRLCRASRRWAARSRRLVRL